MAIIERIPSIARRRAEKTLATWRSADPGSPRRQSLAADAVLALARKPGEPGGYRVLSCEDRAALMADALLYSLRGGQDADRRQRLADTLTGWVSQGTLVALAAFTDGADSLKAFGSLVKQASRTKDAVNGLVWEQMANRAAFNTVRQQPEILGRENFPYPGLRLLAEAACDYVMNSEDKDGVAVYACVQTYTAQRAEWARCERAKRSMRLAVTAWHDAKRPDEREAAAADAIRSLAVLIQHNEEGVAIGKDGYLDGRDLPRVVYDASEHLAQLDASPHVELADALGLVEMATGVTRDIIAAQAEEPDYAYEDDPVLYEAERMAERRCDPTDPIHDDYYEAQCEAAERAYEREHAAAEPEPETSSLRM